MLSLSDGWGRLVASELICLDLLLVHDLLVKLLLVLLSLLGQDLLKHFVLRQVHWKLNVGKTHLEVAK